MKGRKTRVTDLTTGKVYCSINEAGRALYYARDSLTAEWSKAGRPKVLEINGHKLLFEESPNGNRSRACRCVETGKVFGSLTEAGEAVGVSSFAISHAIRKGKRSAGYHWRYVSK